MDIENNNTHKETDTLKNSAEEHNQPIYKPKRGRVFLTNLVYDINERMIRRSFKKYGEITDISIPVNPSNNRPKGYAFV